jgi:FG-GAP-like repeat/FG-GAP repeat
VPTSIAVADVNGDGRPDLVVSILCNYPDCHGLAGVLLGNGDGTFQPVATYLSGGFFAESIKAEDVNGDGKTDLLVSNKSTNLIQSGNGIVGVLLNNGDGTFQPVQTYDSGGSDAREIEVADVNADGKPDLLVANLCSGAATCLSGNLAVLLGNGDGTQACGRLRYEWTADGGARRGRCKWRWDAGCGGSERVRVLRERRGHRSALGEWRRYFSGAAVIYHGRIYRDVD